MSGISAVGARSVSSLWRWAPYYYQTMAARQTSLRPAQPETPVEPVEPVRSVASAADTAVILPTQARETPLPSVEDLNNASDNLARMRIVYLDEADGDEALSPWGQTLSTDYLNAGYAPAAGADGADATVVGADGAGESGPTGRVDPAECETCKRRQYQDGSDDPGVSYKMPTHISPEEAGTAVRAHEQEHVVRERAKAEQEGRKVISQSVTIHTAVCPECGRVYVSGGVTRTVTAEDNSDEKERNGEEGEFSTKLGIELDPF